MNEAKISAAFFQDERPEVRQRALFIIANSKLPDVELLMVHAMTDPVEIVWRSAVDILTYRFPWLVLKPSLTLPVPKSVRATPNGILWTKFRDALTLVLKELSLGPDSEKLKRWELLPGAIPDITEILTSLGKLELVEYLEKSVDIYNEHNTEDRQILLAPTYYCNLDCDYCYAKGWQSQFRKNISLPDLKVFFSWCKKQEIRRLVLCGGEPTIYPFFSKLLKEARKSNILVSLTTNLLYPNKVQQIVTSEWISEVIAHYDQGLNRRLKLASRFRDNLAALNPMSSNLYLRYTLTDISTPKEWQNIIELCRKFNIESVHYAFAFNNLLQNNRTFQFGSYDSNRHFEDLFDRFTTDCKTAGLNVHLCKPIPLCAFSRKNLNKFLRSNMLRSACAAYLRCGTQNLTVNPDLSTYPCNSLGVRGPAITEFKTLHNASQYYREGINKLLFLPYFEQCKQCLFYYRGFCQGVCLTEKYNMITESDRKNVFTDKRKKLAN